MYNGLTALSALALIIPSDKLKQSTEGTSLKRIPSLLDVHFMAPIQNSVKYAAKNIPFREIDCVVRSEL